MPLNCGLKSIYSSSRPIHHIRTYHFLSRVSLNPILFSQVPALDTVLTKLSTFIDNAPLPSSTF
ncbi:hypothetical protein L208DRAFT_1412609 [Tricholoma matsutake]|nr:hypothetical protein L208DRAFT_1412609 [Tricholoma matsutake 945]